jgi:hypothetical protein
MLPFGALSSCEGLCSRSLSCYNDRILTVYQTQRAIVRKQSVIRRLIYGSVTALNPFINVMSFPADAE